MSLHLVSDAIDAYCENHTTSESPLLAELNRETYQKVLLPRMLSGHLQGRFLSLIAKLMQPKLILEIGTYTGYSALCMAEGLGNEGVLHTIDINEELQEMVKRYVKKAGLESRIVQHIGDAAAIIPTLQGPYDLVFIDADKINYKNYYNMVVPLTRKGGLIIADNVLWSGKVVDSAEKDKDTQALRDFSEYVKADNRVEQCMLPLRDGLLMVSVL